MKIKNYIVFSAALLCTSSVAADDMQGPSTQHQYSPTAEQMILDGLIYRPISLAGTLVGAGIFIATLPFSLFGGNVGEAKQRLVDDPASNTFQRCLGCLPQYLYDDYPRW